MLTISASSGRPCRSTCNDCPFTSSDRLHPQVQFLRPECWKFLESSSFISFRCFPSRSQHGPRSISVALEEPGGMGIHPSSHNLSQSILKNPGRLWRSRYSYWRLYIRHGHWEQVTLRATSKRQSRAQHGAVSYAVRLKSVLVRVNTEQMHSILLYISGFQIVVRKRVTFIWYASSFNGTF